MSTVADRICEELNCVESASTPVVVQGVGTLKFPFVLCQRHADRLQAGVAYTIQKEHGQQPVIVIDE